MATFRLSWARRRSPSFFRTASGLCSRRRPDSPLFRRDARLLPPSGAPLFWTRRCGSGRLAFRRRTLGKRRPFGGGAPARITRQLEHSANLRGNAELTAKSFQLVDREKAPLSWLQAFGP